VIANDSIKIVDYLDGFQIEFRGSRTPKKRRSHKITNSEQYAGGVLQFFPHPEGYVKATSAAATPGSPPSSYLYDYVYNYTDHLGNIRLSYSKDPATNELKIMDENHYYPFGLKHSVYSTGSKKDYKEDPSGPGGTVITNVMNTEYLYKYNGFEYQDELGLGLYDYGARLYDPAIGRWHVIDPLTELSRRHSPYAYALNNPVYFIDPDGMFAEGFNTDELSSMGDMAFSETTGNLPTGDPPTGDPPTGDPNYPSPGSEGSAENPVELETATVTGSGRSTESSAAGVEMASIEPTGEVNLNLGITGQDSSIAIEPNMSISSGDVLAIGLTTAVITSQLDSPLPGPADIVAIAIAGTTLQVAGLMWITEFAAEHTKGARPSTKGKHEKGNARRTSDRGGEKGDSNRRPPSKKPNNWKGPWPPKN